LKLAIDADIILYQASLGAQEKIVWDAENVSIEADINKAKAIVRNVIKEYQNYTGVKEFVLCFSHHKNFRKEIWPDYKLSRKDSERPVLLGPLREWVIESYPSLVMENLEADDVLGILATRHPGEIIHVSMDKDLQCVPGKMLHVKKNRKHILMDISPEDAKRFHYQQSMTGDMCDGVPGVYGIGPAKANKYLDKYGVLWSTVVKCYTDNGLTEDEALRNAIMVKMLDHTMYNDGVITTWSPPDDERSVSTHVA
jgi:DNA polymerase-1